MMLRCLSICIVFIAALNGCQQTETPSSPLPTSNVEEEHPVPASLSTFDTVIVRTLPLLPNGRAATVTQKMFAESWQDSVRWSLTVTDEADTLHHWAGVDPHSDETYEMVAYDEGCAPLLACKQLWYRHEFLRPHLETVRVSELGPLFDGVAARSYRTMGYGEIEAAELEMALRRFYTDRPMVSVLFRTNPFEGGGGYAYDPDLKRLVFAWSP